MYAFEFTLAAFNSDIIIQSASKRHVQYNGNEMTPGSSGGGVFVNGQLVAMNQVQINDADVEEEIIPMEFCDSDGLPLRVEHLSKYRASSEDKALDKEIVSGEQSAKRVKTESETVASRSVSDAILNSAIILCRCKRFMHYWKEIEDSI
eukprot:CAMPEP_0176183052 /NCGR_PEP_ID=MMETSP0121_2-20121125/77_1 /TAXON_ID=160619 /ORGANISM="Kryptoperidinium foliaceum, Strain CCMP 1326" /LENGTH=148 /DNA_ID=CAMNT_0017521337 /DNA_START=281 /DNA_END=727 /DNA_ORIENTATION=+